MLGQNYGCARAERSSSCPPLASSSSGHPSSDVVQLRGRRAQGSRVGRGRWERVERGTMVLGEGLGLLHGLESVLSIYVSVFMRTPVLSHSSSASSSPSSSPHSSSGTRSRSPYAVQRTLIKRVLPSRMSPKPLASKTFLDDRSRELDSAQGSFICDVCGSRDGCTREEAGSGNHLCEDCWEESQRTRAAELNEERTAKNCSWAMEEESTDDDRYGMDEEDEEMEGSDDEYEVEEPDEEEEEDSLVDSMCPDFAHRSVMALELGRAAQDQEELRLNKELLDAFYNTEVNRDLLTQLYTKKRSAKNDEEEEGCDDEKEAQSISFSTQGLVRFFDSAASMADRHIQSFPLEIKAFDGQSGHQANYIGSAMEEDEEEEEGSMLDADYCDEEEGEEDVKADEDGSESTAESDGEADDDDDDEDWDTSSLAEYTTDELSRTREGRGGSGGLLSSLCSDIRDLMSTPRGSLP